MKIKTGDRVKFLNDTGGGVVISLSGKNTVMVRTDEGFDIPVAENEIIPDADHSYEETSHKARTNEKKTVVPASFPKGPKVSEPEPLNTDEELVFAVHPVQKGAELSAHLVNNTSYNIHYVITTRGQEETLLFDEGTMEARTQMLLREFIPAGIKELIRFEIQVIFFKNEHYIPRDPLVKALFMDPSEVYSGRSLVENDYLGNKALVFTVADLKKKSGFTVPGGKELTSITQNAPSDVGPRSKKKSPDAPEEVDLHIEAITDSFSGLSNSEIMEMQMSRFRVALDTAVIHKTRKIIFIHGVGNGKLKHSLRKALDDKYPDLRYQDASFREYGYGATMVIIP